MCYSKETISTVISCPKYSQIFTVILPNFLHNQPSSGRWWTWSIFSVCSLLFPLKNFKRENLKKMPSFFLDQKLKITFRRIEREECYQMETIVWGMCLKSEDLVFKYLFSICQLDDLEQVTWPLWTSISSLSWMISVRKKKWDDMGERTATLIILYIQ